VSLKALDAIRDAPYHTKSSLRESLGVSPEEYERILQLALTLGPLNFREVDVRNPKVNVLDLLKITERQLEVKIPEIVKKVVEKWGREVLEFEDLEDPRIVKLAKYIRNNVVPKIVVSDDVSERNMNRITAFILAKLYKHIKGKEWEQEERQALEKKARPQVAA
jgi:hypothetical protein